jgi:thymidylate synthase (FAD)
MQVDYVDHMGHDIRVVDAARVSFRKMSDWEYIHDETGEVIGKDVYESDQKLIRYLATHNHWTPFSHVQITLREKVPIFVARQRFKHMVGFSYNEVSRRYVDDTPEFFVPDKWRRRAENAKQGSSDEVVERFNEYGVVANYGDAIDHHYKEFLIYAEGLYSDMITAGVAPEQARMVLPQSMYTEYFVTGSLAAWARAYKLRVDAHAQKEIQAVATRWDEIITELGEMAYSWTALKL